MTAMAGPTASAKENPSRLYSAKGENCYKPNSRTNSLPIFESPNYLWIRLRQVRIL